MLKGTVSAAETSTTGTPTPQQKTPFLQMKIIGNPCKNYISQHYGSLLGLHSRQCIYFSLVPAVPFLSYLKRAEAPMFSAQQNSAVTVL